MLGCKESKLLKVTSLLSTKAATKRMSIKELTCAEPVL